MRSFIAIWLGFSLLAALALSPVASRVPEGTVVSIGNKDISEEQYQEIRQAVLSGQELVLDAPDYPRCASDFARNLRAAERPVPNPGELISECAELDKQIAETAISALIQSEWVRLDAARVGATVSDEELEAAFQEQKQQSFPTKAAYQEFLRSSGRTEDALREQVRAALLTQKLQQYYLQKRMQPISEGEIRELYEQSREQLPEGAESSEIKEAISQQIMQQRQQEILNESFEEITKRYRPKTECLTVKVPLCDNGPQPELAPPGGGPGGPPPGGPGGPPPPPPPGGPPSGPGGPPADGPGSLPPADGPQGVPSP